LVVQVAQPTLVAAPPLSFEEVYLTRRVRLLQVAVLITGSPPVAEEVVQDAFIQLYRRWPQIDHPGAWVRSAVVSGCRTWQRRHIREREHQADDEFVVVDPDGIAVRQALRALTVRQRSAVVLRYFEDLSEREIAELLDCKRGTVKSLLSRSMEKLRRELDDD
jgi:RNA polymerase sigma-70 factor (sigma-E family)